MKQYTIKRIRIGYDGKTMESEFTGTIPELVSKFSYTLEVGRSYERERGNRKVDIHPKSIRSLVDNLNRAVNNAASNGCSNTFYKLKEV